MVKKYEDIQHIMIHEMKGGKGDVEKISSVEPGEYESGAKVVARLVLRPGVSIGKHTHVGEEEIMTILSGSARYFDGDQECILKAGDVTVCKNGEGHSVENASDTENLEIFALVITV